MNQHERNTSLVTEIKAAQAVIQRNQDTGESYQASIVGALTGMLSGMAGLGEYATHPT